MDELRGRSGSTGAGPAAGWYTNSDGVLQWWDGKAWGPVAPPTKGAAPSTTAQVTAQELVPQNAAFADPSELLQDKQRSVLGVWSIILAIAGGAMFFVPRTGAFFPIGFASLGAVVALIGITRWRSHYVGGSVWGLAFSAVFVVMGLANIGSTPSPIADTSSVTSERADSSSTEPSPQQRRDSQMEQQGFRTWQTGELWIKAAEAGSFTCDSGTRCLWYTLASYHDCPSGFYVKADVLNVNGVAIGWTNEITASVAAKKAVAFQLRTPLDASTIRPTEIRCMG